MAQVRAASCPRCGSEVGAGAVSCSACGFGFVEGEPASAVRLPRLSGRMLVAGLAAVGAVGAVGAGVVALGDSGKPAPPRPESVGAFRAEGRLLRQLTGGGLGDAVSVDCAGPVRAGRSTRCQVGYSNGDTQLILVGLDADRTIDLEIPYPAQRRPG